MNSIISLLITLMLLLSSCQSETDLQRNAIQEIISTHFHDLPVVNELMTVVSLENWLIGRMDSILVDNDTYTMVPPPPPLDTIIFSEGFIIHLLESGTISQEEADELLEKINVGENRLSLQAKVNPEDESVISSEYYYSVLYSNPIGYANCSVYMISIPILFSNNQKVLIAVNYPGIGYNYIFEKIDGKWEIIYQVNTWIS